MPAAKTKTNRADSPAPNVIACCVLILGDQLDHQHPCLGELNPATDRLVMIESVKEAQHVWSHKARIALFLSAMRHYADWLREQSYPLDYLQDQPDFAQALIAHQKEHAWNTLKVVEPGDWRVADALKTLCRQHGWFLVVVPDTHFLCSTQAFATWARRNGESAASLRMEFFYRWMRKRLNILLDEQGEPVGGRWNFDAENRKGFPKTGPGTIAPPAFFEPDSLTTQVLATVEQRYSDHPGSLSNFGWAVTRQQALKALEVFVCTRLKNFGDYQDAMWTNEVFGWHALLSTSLNLKLLRPLEVIDAALEQWQKQNLPLAGVEGFIRQVLGWREFIRGVYWLDMPGMGEANFYQHRRALPRWYWDGNTNMNCMKQCIGQTLSHGYAHHIQRLMVTGNFALMAQIKPAEVADWYLAVYVDAVQWVEHPNTLGMALFANGGRFTSKPYVASGAYIKRMSNYCQGCQYAPEQKTGDKACPITTLYWNFLDQHADALAANPRTMLMARNVEKLTAPQRQAIRDHAHNLLNNLDAL
jgi:deoxyribodipyrimidine photolyase-related protein